MSSNSLLALLNLSSPSASSSAPAVANSTKEAPPKSPFSSVEQSPTATTPAPSSSLPTRSSHTTSFFPPPSPQNNNTSSSNPLLQSLLGGGPTGSPRSPSSTPAIEQSPLSRDANATTSTQRQQQMQSPIRSPAPSSTQDGASQLLALLSGAARSSPSGTSQNKDQKTPLQSPASRDESAQKPQQHQTTKASPPPSTVHSTQEPSNANLTSGQLDPQSQSQSRPQPQPQPSHTPTMFDFVSPFDMLKNQSRQMSPSKEPLQQYSNQKENVSSPSPNVGQSPPAPTSATPPSHCPTPSAAPSSPRRYNRSDAPLKEAKADRTLHASRHLSGLHASKGFKDDISSGHSITTMDPESISPTGIHTLDLLAPQPAGSNSLYPAKLEFTAVSLIETQFAPPTVSLGKAHYHKQQVAALGGRMLMYVMKKSKVRIIDEETGARAMVKTQFPIQSIFASSEQVSSGDQAWWRFAAITDREIVVWQLKKSSGTILDKDIGPELLTRIQYEPKHGSSCVFACFESAPGGQKLLAIWEDGEITREEVTMGLVRPRSKALLETKGLEQPMAIATSQDDSLLAILLGKDSSETLTLEVQQKDSPKKHRETIPSLPLKGRKMYNVSFFGLLTTSQKVRSIVIGFDKNQVIAFYDPAKGRYEYVFDFQHSRNRSKDDSLADHFQLVACLPAPHCGILVFSSVRASVFSIQLSSTHVEGATIGSELSQAEELLSRIEKRDLIWKGDADISIRECALPESYTSVTIEPDPENSGGVRVVAIHPAGVHIVRIPAEAFERVPEIEGDLMPREAIQETNIVHTRDGDEDNEVEVVAVNGRSVEPEIRASQNLASHGDASSLPVSADLHGGSQIGEDNVRSSATASRSDSMERNADNSGIPTGPAVKAVVNGIAKEVQDDKTGTSSGKKRTIHASSTSHNRTLDASNSSSTSNNIEGKPLGKSDQIKAERKAKMQLDYQVSKEDVKTMIDALENRLMSQLSLLKEPTSQGSHFDSARAISQKIIPHLDSLICESMRSEIRQSVVASVNQTVASEMHNLVMKPDVTAHLSRAIASSILPNVQRTAMDVVTRAMAPHFEDVMNSMVGRIESRIEGAITGIRKDIVAEQSNALLQSEASLRDMVRQMSELRAQLESLGRSNGKMERALNEVKEEQKVVSMNAVKATQHPKDSRDVSIPTSAISSAPRTPLHRTLPSQQATATSPVQSRVVPQQSTPQQAPSKVTHQNAKAIEDSILTALSSPQIETDVSALKATLTELERRYSNPSSVLWSHMGETGGKATLSQAALLALVHRLSRCLRDAYHSTIRDAFTPEQAVPWIEACVAALDKQDPMIGKYVEYAAKNISEALLESQERLARHGASLWWTRERLVQGSLRFLQM